jgi:hypothetical protein
MGLFITGELLPRDITQEQWTHTYDEALQLVQAYDFLDIIIDEERFADYGLRWEYGVITKERTERGKTGVFISGAYKGFICAEMQFLYKDLDTSEHEKPREQADNLCHDALLTQLDRVIGGERRYNDRVKHVFGNKTQGYDHHIPLLAIALLFEDRLGKAFTVSGDITRGQIKAAVEWANEHLASTISLPCRMDNDRLLERLSAFVPRESLIDAFMYLTLCPKDEPMNAFLQEHFDETEIHGYWEKRASSCVPNTLGASDFVREFFGMSDDVGALARACAKRFTPEEFAKQLIKSKVFIEEKNSNNPTEVDEDRDTPAAIEVVMGQIFGKLLGLANSAVSRYIPLEQVLRQLESVFDGESYAIVETAIMDAYASETDSSEKPIDKLAQFEELSNAMNERADQVDIFEPEDLVFYELGDTLDDRLKANLKRIREFVDERKGEAASTFRQNHLDESTDDMRIARLLIVVKCCDRVLPKTAWDYFEERIADDDYYFTLYALLMLKADTLPLSHYAKGLLCNTCLFEQVRLSEDIGWLDVA